MCLIVVPERRAVRVEHRPQSLLLLPVRLHPLRRMRRARGGRRRPSATRCGRAAKTAATGLQQGAAAAIIRGGVGRRRKMMMRV